MRMLMKRAALTVAISAVSCAVVGEANAQNYYQGKNMTFVVGASPGGSFDTFTRLLARRIGNDIPGNPTVIVQNMPGAGSLVAANHLYNVALPDGLTVGAFAVAVVLQQAIGGQTAKFDGRKFGWIGSPSKYHSICVVRQESGIKTVQDWYAAKKPLEVGGMAPGAGPSNVPRILNAALGLPIKLIEGYGGGAAVRLALERGEVEGYCGSWQGVRSVWQDAIKSGKYTVLLQIAPERHSDLVGVPLASEFAKTEEAKQLLDVIDTAHGIEFVYALPPGVPADRLQAVRTAFMKTMKSPELTAEAVKAQLDVDPVDGETIGKKIDGLYQMPESTLLKVKEIFLPKQ